jgi:hypothetical protein
MAYEGIDSELKNRMTAFGANPNALAQKYQQNGQLLDLLALQKLKKEKEEAKQFLAGQMQQNPPTIKKQREDELLQMTKDELVGQTGGILNQQKAKEDANLRKVAARGMPRPRPRPKPPGGIGALQRGVPSQNPMMAMANRGGAPIQQRPNVNPMMMAMANRRGNPMQQRPVNPMAGGIPRLPANNMQMASSGGIIGFAGPSGSVVPVNTEAAAIESLEKYVSETWADTSVSEDEKKQKINTAVDQFFVIHPNVTTQDIPRSKIYPWEVDVTDIPSQKEGFKPTATVSDTSGTGLDKVDADIIEKAQTAVGQTTDLKSDLFKNLASGAKTTRGEAWDYLMPEGAIDALKDFGAEQKAMYKELTDPKAAAEADLMARLAAIGRSGNLAEAGRMSREAAIEQEKARRLGKISGLKDLDQSYRDRLKVITDARTKAFEIGEGSKRDKMQMIASGTADLSKLSVQAQTNINQKLQQAFDLKIFKDEIDFKKMQERLAVAVAWASDATKLKVAEAQAERELRIAQMENRTQNLLIHSNSVSTLQREISDINQKMAGTAQEIRELYKEDLQMLEMQIAGELSKGNVKEADLLKTRKKELENYIKKNIADSLKTQNNLVVQLKKRIKDLDVKMRQN